MNHTFDGARIRREELEREIDSLRMERLIESNAPARLGFAGRARAGLGRSLIQVGTSLVGQADAAAAAASARSRTSGSRA